jgi:uncharacterized protein
MMMIALCMIVITIVKLTKEMSFIVNPELFFLKRNDHFVIYSPLTGSILDVSDGVIDMLKACDEGLDIGSFPKDILDQLIDRGVLLHPESLKSLELPTNSEYFPTSVTLLPTYQCNLECKYCYSNGGSNVGSNLKIDIAKKSIDFVIANALKLEKPSVSLGFHGGGEPLHKSCFPFVQEMVKYFRRSVESSELHGHISIATNGILSETILNWIWKNIDFVTLSCDGSPDIQNFQRPIANSKDYNHTSSWYIERTASFFETKKIQYAIRSTITDFSVDRISEIVQYFVINAPSAKTIHLEPLAIAGRANDSSLKTPSNAKMIAQLELVHKNFNGAKQKVYVSGCDISRISNKFCGAYGRNFFINPQGFVTTCLEVCRQSDQFSNIFFIGHYHTADNAFVFDNDRIDFLSKLTVNSKPRCSNCIAKYNCAGGCLIKDYREANIKATNGLRRCNLTQEIVEKQIFSFLQ